MTAKASAIVPPQTDMQRADLHVVAAIQIHGHCIGTLAGWCAEEGPRVDYPNNPHGPLVAQTIIPLSAERVASLAAEGRKVLLTFDAQRSDSPIILGLLQPTPREAKDRGDGQVSPIDAFLDGKRVRLEGKDEVSLQCGKASVTLRRNGRVVIRGSYVETRSEGVNRVKGGTVQIN